MKSNTSFVDGANNTRPVIVYHRSFQFACHLSAADIVQLPVHSATSKRKDCPLVLCNDFLESHGLHCPRQTTCPFVHTRDIHAAFRTTVHINYTYTSEDEVLYDTMTSDDWVDVAGPNFAPMSERLPIRWLLPTRGVKAYIEHQHQHCEEPIDRPALAHCVHFLFNRICNRGESCRFVHCISLGSHALRGIEAPCRRKSSAALSWIPPLADIRKLHSVSSNGLVTPLFGHVAAECSGEQIALTQAAAGKHPNTILNPSFERASLRDMFPSLRHVGPCKISFFSAAGDQCQRLVYSFDPYRNRVR